MPTMNRRSASSLIQAAATVLLASTVLPPICPCPLVSAFTQTTAPAIATHPYYARNHNVPLRSISRSSGTVTSSSASSSTLLEMSSTATNVDNQQQDEEGHPNTDTDSSSTDKPPTYPALTNDEVEQFLSRIPVYAVTDANTGGVVLMSERSGDGDGGDGPNSDQGIAYLFITKEAATATLRQLSGTASPQTTWQITALSLGAIWFELLSGDATVQTQSVESGETMDTAEETVDYRLVPDYRDLNGARDLLSSTPEAKAALERLGTFASAYGDVPVFMDLQIRMEERKDDGTTVERFPLYLALQDMVETCQQFLEAGGGDKGTYEAAVNVAELKSLVEQMQQPSTVDFRKAVLIPPTPLPEKPETKPLGIVGLDDDGSAGYSPSMNDNWAD